MNWYTVNYALGTFASFLLGLFVLYRGETRQATRRAWFSLCVFVSLWHAGKFLIEIAPSEYHAQQAVYVIYLGAIFLPACYLHFILALLDEEKKYRRLLIACYVWSLAQLCLLGGGWLIQGVKYAPHGAYYEIPSENYWLYIVNYSCLPGLALIKLVWAFYQTDLVVKRNQFKYVISSSLIGFLAGATSFLPFVNNMPPFGAPLVYFYTLPITYAVARYRLMDIEVIMKKSLIYGILLLTLLMPCYLIVLWGQQLAFGTINSTFSLVTLMLFVIVAFLFPKLRFRTEEALERALFQKRIDHRKTLVRSSRDMVSIIDLEALSNNLVKTVGRALGIERASLYLVDEAKGNYKLAAKLESDAHQYLETAILRDDSLVLYLQTTREGVVKEELEIGRENPAGKRTAERMRQLEAEISVPIVSKDKLIGILNLGHKEGKEIYSNEDLELLSTLANQAAIAIENARLYENLKQSQATLRRADRLSSLGLLTAGLAHEIRNPLVAIRTFTQLLPERYDDAEFREGFQGLALKEVDRICGLINDLLSFARPSRPNVAEENVNEIVESIARILETEAKEKGVAIVRDFATELPKVWIDREQMKQVFMNLILNAIQAMKEGGSIFISTRLNSKHDAGHTARFVQIEVRDTGIGIPEENLDHIFDPFFTSKDEGSGLGLSISHQIVQEHGGYMTVESKAGKGASFFVNVPVGKPVRAGVNGRAHADEANPSH